MLQKAVHRIARPKKRVNCNDLFTVALVVALKHTHYRWLVVQ